MKTELVAPAKAIEQRFWSKVNVKPSEPDQCWEWTGYKHRDGYGRLTLKSQKINAHQVAFMLSKEYLPPVVRHKCDNRACCNPNHLLPGTHRDNMNDVIERKRQAGERNGRALLSVETVLKIKADKTSSNRQLSKELGVHHSTVSAIRLGKSWKHVGST